MNHLTLILKREYLNKVRNKSFIIMTFLSPLIFVGIFALVAYLSSLNSETMRTITIFDESGMFEKEFENSEYLHYNFIKNVPLSEAKAKVETSEEYGLLHIPNAQNLNELSKEITFYSEDSPSLSILDDIDEILENKINNLKLNEAGIDPENIKNLSVRVETNIETFKGKETSKLGSGLKLIFGGFAGYMLFMFIIIYGNMIMRSVIEEKTSRIIEVIISSVKPIKLLLGKIFGTTLAGITQVLAWVILIAILSTVVSSVFGIDVSSQQPMIGDPTDGNTQQLMQQVFTEINNLPIANLIIMFLLFFVGGYLLYASLYAAIGAAVDSETDTQQFMMPILMPLILAVYVGFFTVIDNPHGTVSQVFSYIPFTSPVVMLMRIPFGVPLWQQFISLIILFGTFMLTVWFAAKIYRVGILMYGKKTTYKEIFKWLKY